ncbi:MAG: hypothetical protein V9E91_07160 [Burkholderiaceae bacterium]
MLGFASAGFAKLPAPSDEAKAKAAEAAAKTAWSGKVDNYLLCKSQDKTAAHYYKTNKTAKPAVATAPCADPGPFVYPLPEAAAPAAAGTVVVAKPAVVAAPVAAAKKALS